MPGPPRPPRPAGSPSSIGSSFVLRCSAVQERDPAARHPEHAAVEEELLAPDQRRSGPAVRVLPEVGPEVHAGLRPGARLHEPAPPLALRAERLLVPDVEDLAFHDADPILRFDRDGAD